ncbi:MAG: TRAP transporter small permease [Paracoccaceae bacterium]
MINRILIIWTWVETLLIGLLILAALGSFMGGALLRAIAPMHAVDWAEEVSLYFIIWATVLSGSVLVAERRHIATEIFISMLPTAWQRFMGWAMTLLTIGFCAAMAIYGWQAYEFALLLDERSASTLRAPQGPLVFLALPVGMMLILGRVFLMLLQGNRPFGGDLAPVHTPLDPKVK